MRKVEVHARSEQGGSGLSGKINLKEVQYLIAHKPLALANLEHTSHNKKMIRKSLKILLDSTEGRKTFAVLRNFLQKRAVNHELSKRQDGVRTYLLKEMEQVEKGGLLTGLFR